MRPAGRSCARSARPTRLPSADFARAITRETALILKVHRSNFFMDGFVDSPSTEAIAKLARGKRVPFVEDLGSGAMIQTETVPGLEHEPTPAEVLRNGVDLVCFSGDKLFGGPQAGIIAGKAKLVAALKREPFFRALRCDKLILAALEATVDIYLRNSTGLPECKRALTMRRVTMTFPCSQCCTYRTTNCKCAQRRSLRRSTGCRLRRQ